MKFVDTTTNIEHRFSVGRELESGRYYLSIPVSNRLCDYEEYYLLPRADHDAYPENIAALAEFATQCRAHLHDERLYLKPGSDRGV